MSNCHYGNYIDYIIRDLLVWTKTTSLFLMIIWDNWFDMQYHWHGKLSKTYLWTVYIQGISMLRHKLVEILLFRFHQIFCCKTIHRTTVMSQSQ